MSSVGTFSVEGGHVRPVKVNVRDLRFKCLRCAAFCCWLGGPVVSRKDINRLRRGVEKIDQLIETVDVGTRKARVLSSKPNGQCILLSKRSQNRYGCLAYEFRPDTCRSYPFRLIRKESRLEVFVLPCRGLNRTCGRLVDEEFVREHLEFATAP